MIKPRRKTFNVQFFYKFRGWHVLNNYVNLEASMAGKMSHPSAVYQMSHDFILWFSIFPCIAGLPETRGLMTWPKEVQVTSNTVPFSTLKNNAKSNCSTNFHSKLTERSNNVSKNLHTPFLTGRATRRWPSSASTLDMTTWPRTYVSWAWLLTLSYL